MSEVYCPAPGRLPRIAGMRNRNKRFKAANG
jgi:hypothetical protein